MKRLFSYMPKKLLAGFVVLAALVGVTSAAIAGFGPDRPTKAWSGSANGFDHVTFNSFTGVPNGIGDERDFFRGNQIGSNTGWVDPVNNVVNDATIEAKIYIHNNASPSLNDAPNNPGVAKNVSVKVELPSGIALSQEAKAYIEASNAQPQQIFDTLSFTGVNGSLFGLEYVPGSAQLHNGSTVTALSDTLVTTGVNIGDQKGCFEYVREITFRMKVKKPGYQIQKTARIKGEGNDKWRKEVNAKIGDKIEWEIYFQNTGTTLLKNVTVLDVIPSFHKVVPGSIKLYNAAYPSGYVYPDSAIQANGKQVNVTISDYAPGANAYFYLTTEIQDVPELRCGVQQMANVVYVTPQGLSTLNDNAKVNVINQKSCDEPTTPTYACKAVNVTKIADRKVRVSVDVIAAPSNRVSVKSYEYNYGDGSQTLVTDKNPVEYAFAKDGTYKISVKVNFTVDGQTKTSTEKCEAVVSFTPTEIPNTGVGSMFGLFAATAIVGAIAHRVWTIRRLGR